LASRRILPLNGVGHSETLSGGRVQRLGWRFTLNRLMARVLDFVGDRCGCAPSEEAKGIVACVFLRSLNILPHPHRGDSNIEICCSCGRNLSPHTASAVEKQSEPKKQRGSQPVLWCAINHHTHIKSAPATQQNPTAPQSDCGTSTTSLQLCILSRNGKGLCCPFRWLLCIGGYLQQ